MFALGCLGCGLSADIVTLNAMRALTGIGGGGLVTMGMIYGCSSKFSDVGMLTYSAKQPSSIRTL